MLFLTVARFDTHTLYIYNILQESQNYSYCGSIYTRFWWLFATKYSAVTLHVIVLDIQAIVAQIAGQDDAKKEAWRHDTWQRYVYYSL